MVPESVLSGYQEPLPRRRVMVGALAALTHAALIVAMDMRWHVFDGRWAAALVAWASFIPWTYLWGMFFVRNVVGQTVYAYLSKRGALCLNQVRPRSGEAIVIQFRIGGWFRRNRIWGTGTWSIVQGWTGRDLRFRDCDDNVLSEPPILFFGEPKLQAFIRFLTHYDSFRAFMLAQDLKVEQLRQNTERGLQRLVDERDGLGVELGRIHAALVEKDYQALEAFRISFEAAYPPEVTFQWERLRWKQRVAEHQRRCQEKRRRER